jgi:hypothetical protein
MNRRFAIIAALAVWASAARDASAHFLFIHIGPVAEAGRTAEVYFSEQAQAGDPTFIDKIAHTKLWVQKTPGQFQALQVRKASDRLRAFLPTSGSIAVIGDCTYGVLSRETPFLLRHYPKAIAGKPADLNGLLPNPNIPLEIVATVDDQRVTFVALYQGKPVPQAVFTTIDSDLTNEELSAGADGRATWKPPTTGRYSVYTRLVTKESGEFNGKKYQEVRNFATIAFDWPLERRGADPEAVALFQEAIATRAQWQAFPGFTAHISGDVDGRLFHGSVTVTADGAAKLDINDPPSESWVKDQLESIAMHRIAGAQGASSDADPVLRFAEPGERHPLGKLLIFEGGSFASSYRVKDQQVMVVNRSMGKLNMTITVLDNERNTEGRYLPHSYVVQFWDAASGELKRTDTLQDRWQRVASWDLPSSHTMTTSSEAGLSVKQFELSEHEMLKAGK